MMNPELLLIGSIPYDTAEDAIKNFGVPLAKHLPAIPDGEPGDRRWWVQRLSYQVFNGHPQLETTRRPALDNGVERLLPRDTNEFWQFRIKDGVDKIQFGDPGWRLGFARDAISSYFVFKTMRDQGKIPAGVRFQVSLPLVNSVVRPITFPDRRDLERVRPGYEAAMRAEIETILAKIPHKDLALQWDLAVEVIETYQAAPGPARARVIEEHTAQVRNLSKIVPKEVALGIHFCFGTYGGWPRFVPEDLGPAVELANTCAEVAGRPLNWIHLPALDTTEEKFYAPLARLNARGAHVYLGLVHHMETFKQRLAVARKFLPNFGVGAYCGFGRNAPETLPETLKEHLDAAKLVARK
jgi:hypothetical protein